MTLVPYPTSDEQYHHCTYLSITLFYDILDGGNTYYARIDSTMCITKMWRGSDANSTLEVVLIVGQSEGKTKVMITDHRTDSQNWKPSQSGSGSIRVPHADEL